LQIHFRCNAFDLPFSGEGEGVEFFLIYSLIKLTTTALCGGGGCLCSIVWAKFLESFNAIPFIYPTNLIVIELHFMQVD